MAAALCSNRRVCPALSYTVACPAEDLDLTKETPTLILTEGAILGGGAFSRVSEVTEESTGNTYAMKRMRKSAVVQCPEHVYFEQVRSACMAAYCLQATLQAMLEINCTALCKLVLSCFTTGELVLSYSSGLEQASGPSWLHMNAIIVLWLRLASVVRSADTPVLPVFAHNAACLQAITKNTAHPFCIRQYATFQVWRMWALWYCFRSQRLNLYQGRPQLTMRIFVHLCEHVCNFFATHCCLSCAACTAACY